MLNGGLVGFLNLVAHASQFYFDHLYERTASNQRAYHQPTRTKAQRYAKVARDSYGYKSQMQVMVPRWQE